MANEKKNILYVGDHRMLYDLFRSSINRESKKINISGFAPDVSRAVRGITSGEYSGVLMQSLVFPLGEDYEKLAGPVSQFDKWDDSPCIFRSGGLYIVKSAVEKGLVCVVRKFAESDAVLGEVERLGGKVVKAKVNTGIGDCLRALEQNL